MEEVLTNFKDETTPPAQRGNYVLRLVEEPNDLGTRHCVQRTRARWNDETKEVVFEETECDYFWIYAEAKARYAERRAELALDGYVYSDLDW